jgi:hypothetical protein
VRFELVMGVVEVSLDGSVLDGAVHAFDLPVGPGMVGTALWRGRRLQERK